MESAQFSVDLIRNEFASLHNNMRDYLDFLARSDNLKLIFSMPNDSARAALLNIYLHDFTSLHEWIFMAAVELPDGIISKSFNFNDLPFFNDFMNNPGYQQLRGRTSGQRYSPIHFLDIGRAHPEHSVSSLSKIYTIDGSEYIFTLFMGIDSTLRRNNVFMDNRFDDFIIINRNNETIIASGTDFENRVCLDDFTLSQGDFDRDGGRYLYATIPSSNWIFVAFASYHRIFQSIVPMLLIIIAFYLISPIIYFLFIVPTNTRYLAPLSKLSSVMNAYSIGEKIHCDLTTGDEIEDLATSFNGMVDKINQQLVEIALHEQEKSLTLYKLLTTQVDPHFIFNTMNIINVLARKGDANAIIDVNTSLIRILQDRLSSKEKVFDTVHSEINTLKQYINIMDYRYQNNVKFIFDVDEKLWETLIPKNMIQPFVENSFFHGLTTEDGVLDGDIQITLYRQNTSTIVEISDNGCGMEPKRLTQLLEGSLKDDNAERVRIGVDNVRQRLQYIYGSDEYFCIRSALSEGTTVILELPDIDKS